MQLVRFDAQPSARPVCACSSNAQASSHICSDNSSLTQAHHKLGLGGTGFVLHLLLPL